MEEDLVLSPPNDIEAERKLLGLLLVNPTEMNSIPELEPHDFYNGANALLYSHMRDCWDGAINQSKLNDGLLTTLGYYLKECNSGDQTSDFDRVGGWSGLTEYMSDVDFALFVPSRDVPMLAERLRNLRIKRDTMRGNHKINQYAANGKAPIEVLEEMQALNDTLKGLLPAEKPKNPRELCELVIEGITSRRDNPSAGVPCGIPDLDNLTHGWEPGELILIGGIPGSFKTALALTFTHRQRDPVNTLFVSLEMTTKQLIERLFCQITEIPHELFKLGQIGTRERELLERATQIIERLDPVILDDAEKFATVAAVDAHIVARKRQLAAQGKKLDQVIIDHVQLMKGKVRKNAQDKQRQQEIEEISRGMKSLAKKHQVPIILLSQLSRSYATRQNKRHQISDLRDSGALEQDADIIIFTYHHAQHDENTKEPNCLEVIVAKNREGKRGTVYCKLTAEHYGIYPTNDVTWRPEYGTPADYTPPRRKKGSTHAANTTEKESE